MITMRAKYLVGMLSVVALACVGDNNTVPDGGTDASQDGTLQNDGPTESSTSDAGDAGPTCTHACAANYTCLSNGHCGNDAAEIAIGAGINCAVLYAGELWCWGDNTYGQMGVPPSAPITTPQKVAGVPNAAHVTAFIDAVCAADASGAVFCWGANDYGQLGHASGQQGDTATCTDRPCNYVPKSVGGFPGGTKVVQLSMGNAYVDSGGIKQSQFVCARADTGKAYCWGANGLGAAGQALNQLSVPSASEVTPLTGVTDIAAAFSSHACAAANGKVYCWGWNEFGQLGHAPNTSGDQSGNACMGLSYCNPTPAQVGSLTGADHVAAGQEFSCAQLADAGASCWGDDNQGALGDGKNGNSTSMLPAAVVAPLPNALGPLNAHYVTMFAIDATGSAWSWGDNSWGQLGVGSITGPSSCTSPCNSTPQKITAMSNVVQISSGAYEAGAVTADGKVYTWGSGSHGSGDVACAGGTCNPTPQVFTGLPH